MIFGSVSWNKLTFHNQFRNIYFG